MTAAIDQQTLGRWHALQSALALIAPLTEEAVDAAADAAACDSGARGYLAARADTLAGLRDRLVASLRLSAPPAPQQQPSTARMGQGASR